ncbi:o-succinylbenzoate--CoA ligase [Angustibacter sp. McL0619]|uniref:o-succinylbenzoate--CoA ligase n=1 Tax=Angustibacter sp. McL0619 TaxID=3415676 RepID=UPI003CE7CDAC
MPRKIAAIDLSALPLDDATQLLRAALDGSGDALLPTAGDAAAERARHELAAGTALLDGEDDPDDPTALVIATSGSTGPPKGALLQASALRASARATHDRLGGPGSWLLALPTQHVAGVQVLLRSVHAGTVPAVLDLRDGFDLDAFASAATDLADRTGRTYTALVPTQLVRMLADGGRALRALTAFDAVLLGGAAATPALLDGARAAGVTVVTTYGMSETCGGCVYDGLPLDGVQVKVDDRIRLGGPVVALGYRLAPGAPQFEQSGGTRWFSTSDLGELLGERLTVLGRADDVLVTGGVKVSPQAVEAVLAELLGVNECLVVGVPDAEWGQRLVVLVVAEPVPSLEALRHSVSTRLGAAAAPREVVQVESLPTTALGKPDRRAATRLAEAALSR